MESHDGGATWSTPVLVNNDGHNGTQDYAVLAVGPDGTAHLVWYDDRNGTGTSRCLYYSTTGNLGDSFCEPINFLLFGK